MKKVISTTNAPAAIGPYSQAIEANGFVFASGQIPVNPATGEVAEGIEGQAEQVMKNMKNLLEAAGTSMENVVKTTVFIQSMAEHPFPHFTSCCPAWVKYVETFHPEFIPNILRRTARPAPAWRLQSFPRVFCWRWKPSL